MHKINDARHWINRDEKGLGSADRDEMSVRMGGKHWAKLKKENNRPCTDRTCHGSLKQ